MGVGSAGVRLTMKRNRWQPLLGAINCNAHVNFILLFICFFKVFTFRSMNHFELIFVYRARSDQVVLLVFFFFFFA